MLISKRVVIASILVFSSYLKNWTQSNLKMKGAEFHQSSNLKEAKVYGNMLGNR